MCGFDIALSNQLNLKSANTSNVYKNKMFQGDNTINWFRLGSYLISGFKITDNLYCKNESQSLFHTVLQRPFQSKHKIEKENFKLLTCTTEYVCILWGLNHYLKNI